MGHFLSADWCKTLAACTQDASPSSSTACQLVLQEIDHGDRCHVLGHNLVWPLRVELLVDFDCAMILGSQNARARQPGAERL
jgi:hypothetical protein